MGGGMVEGMEGAVVASIQVSVFFFLFFWVVFLLFDAEIYTDAKFEASFPGAIGIMSYHDLLPVLTPAQLAIQAQTRGLHARMLEETNRRNGWAPTAFYL